MAANSLLAIAGLALLAVGAAGVVYGRRRRRERAVIESTPTTDVLRITPGPVEVAGTARPAGDGPIRAPFTDEAALVAEWEIEEYEEAGKHSGWRTVGSGVVSTPFLVDDGTDEVLVRPGDARVEIETRTEPTVEVSGQEEPPEPIREFLALEATPGPSDEPLIESLDWGQKEGDRRYDQHLIRPGEEVYVHGTATRVGAREFGGRDFELVASADDGHPDADVFLVSDRSEADLLAARRDALLYLAGGGLVALAGLAMFVLSVLPPP